MFSGNGTKVREDHNFGNWFRRMETIEKTLCGHVYRLMVKWSPQAHAYTIGPQLRTVSKGHGTFWTWDLAGRCKVRVRGLRGSRLAVSSPSSVFCQCRLTSSCHILLSPDVPFMMACIPQSVSWQSSSFAELLTLRCLDTEAKTLTNAKHMLEITVLPQ